MPIFMSVSTFYCERSSAHFGNRSRNHECAGEWAKSDARVKINSTKYMAVHGRQKRAARPTK